MSALSPHLAQLDEHLSDVLPAEEAKESLWRAFDPVEDRLAPFDFTGCMPGGEVLGKGSLLIEVV